MIYSICMYMPICSLYGIFTYIHHRLNANVGKYSIHGYMEHTDLVINDFYLQFIIVETNAPTFLGAYEILKKIGC